MRVGLVFDGRVFVPEAPVSLPERSRIEVDLPDGPSSSFDQWLESARSAPVIDLVDLDRGDLYP